MVLDDAAICYIDMYRNLINEDDEFCGVLVYNYYNNCYEDEYEPIRGETVMIDDKPVKNCTVPYYRDIIWHSHPITSKSYPSGIDIYKVIEYSSIKVSIIFTNWGVWQIRSFYDDINNINKPPNKKDTIYKLDKYGHELYETLERGKKMFLDISDIQIINDYIDKIQRKYNSNIYIQFDRWDDVYNGMYIIRRNL